MIFGEPQQAGFSLLFVNCHVMKVQKWICNLHFLLILFNVLNNWLVPVLLYTKSGRYQRNVRWCRVLKLHVRGKKKKIKDLLRLCVHEFISGQVVENSKLHL